MRSPPYPDNEEARLAALRRLEILDTLPEQAYDDLTMLAAEICGTPIALMSLVDADRQWFKSRVGFAGEETPRVAFCAHAILQPHDLFVVDDASLDPRFVDDPLVTGTPYVRFCAAMPIVTDGGAALGTLCVLDTRPRTLTDAQQRCLAGLARQASRLLAFREQALDAAREARSHAQLSVEARIRQKRGNELLDLVLRGDRMGLWDLHVPTAAWTVNARELAMLGYDGAVDPPALGTLQDMVHPDDWPLLLDAMQPHRDGKTAFFECTHRIRHRDGRWLWVLDRAVIVERDVWGGPVRIVGTHTDVTEARRNDEQRTRNAERLELALSGGDIGMWDWDKPSGKVVRNAQWAGMFGYSLAETDNEDGLWRSIVHPEDRLASQDLMEGHLRGDTPMFEAEVRMRHRDGHWLWVLDRARVVERDASGEATRVVGINMNITERKESMHALQRATGMLERTGEMARVGGWELDIASQDLTWSDAVFRIHELDPRDPPSLERALGFYGADPRAVVRAALHAVIHDGVPYDLELPMTTARGRPIWVRSMGAAEHRDGVVARVFGSLQDITDRKEAELQRAASEERLRGITDNMPALIAELDTEWRFRFCNETYRLWLGIDPDDVVGKPFREVVDGDYLAGREAWLRQAFDGRKVTFEQTLKLPIGTRSLQTTYLPHYDAAGAVAGVYGMTSDITEQKEIQRRLDALARVDPLTGLANRRQFEERVADAMARTRRTRVPMAVMYLDIDRFKTINDSVGHAGGDEVLKEFAERLRGAVRETDIVARHAGDEFVIVLENISGEQEARNIASKVVEAMRPAFNVLGRPFFVTTSAGVATFDGGDRQVAELLSMADHALYAAKSTGRDRVSVAYH